MSVVWRGDNAPRLDSFGFEYKFGAGGVACFEDECVLTACDCLVLHLRHELSERTFGVPVNKIVLGYDDKNDRMKLFINF